MTQLRQKADEINALDIQVCVVTFELDMFAKAYVRDNGLIWPLLIDEKRELYVAYGMERENWSKLLGPAAMSAYFKLMLKGRMPKNATGDVKQMGGDVLIDPSGIVRLHHVSDNPADRPSVESLLDVVRTATHQSGA